MVERVIIMGAAGRDFHNFNVYFRENERYDVVGFTATQIPDIDGRIYPSMLSGSRYPDGIPIYPDSRLVELIRKRQVDLVAFSYSDVPHIEVMHKASQVTAAGADFIIIGAPYTMLESKRTVISVCAVRTGCGKSQTSRHVVRLLQKMGKRVVCVRHPMPYGDLTRQIVQRFSSRDDLVSQHCTIEEREEYEPVIDMGAVVYAGVDYGLILEAAEKEGDVIVWDGGNNDTPFFKPDLHIVVFDPHRAGHETGYHPGETNMLMADVAVINKVDSALPEKVEQVRRTIATHNPAATIILADSAVSVEDPSRVMGRRVLVVEDGPTLTHGEMAYGAGVIAARRFGAASLADPRPYLKGSLVDTFDRYSHMGTLLPAMGYSPGQIKDLEATINDCPCDLVLSATPIDLTAVVRVNKPVVRVRYTYADNSSPTLEAVIRKRLKDRL
ncbi:cyclic 2,3-diphosphoglycerate synthase [Desulfosarcina ovata]|uniref:GTPase n=1 Tax=Desulfosarcina ovata subsp. ovata TaxID=2752305 RepID=A0A5K8AN37_9BACT|nr:cyclic 2,3-diphosphoglycerate synthase [Desulfosarcina ovata]BBO93290.1 GTPase [Desulfosarcina ovata subsp. ovata]